MPSLKPDVILRLEPFDQHNLQPVQFVWFGEENLDFVEDDDAIFGQLLCASSSSKAVFSQSVPMLRNARKEVR